MIASALCFLPRYRACTILIILIKDTASCRFRTRTTSGSQRVTRYRYVRFEFSDEAVVDKCIDVSGGRGEIPRPLGETRAASARLEVGGGESCYTERTSSSSPPRRRSHAEWTILLIDNPHYCIDSKLYPNVDSFSSSVEFPINAYFDHIGRATMLSAKLVCIGSTSRYMNDYHRYTLAREVTYISQTLKNVVEYSSVQKSKFPCRRSGSLILCTRTLGPTVMSPRPKGEMKIYCPEPPWFALSIYQGESATNTHTTAAMRTSSFMATLRLMLSMNTSNSSENTMNTGSDDTEKEACYLDILLGTRSRPKGKAGSRE